MKRKRLLNFTSFVLVVVVGLVVSNSAFGKGNYYQEKNFCRSRIRAYNDYMSMERYAAVNSIHMSNLSTAGVNSVFLLGMLKGINERYTTNYGSFSFTMLSLNSSKYRLLSTLNWSSFFMATMRTIATCRGIDFMFLRKEIYAYIALHSPIKLDYPPSVYVSDADMMWYLAKRLNSDPNGNVNFVDAYLSTFIGTLRCPEIAPLTRSPQNRAFIGRVLYDFAMQNCQDLKRIRANKTLIEIAKTAYFNNYRYIKKCSKKYRFETYLYPPCVSKECKYVHSIHINKYHSAIKNHGFVPAYEKVE